MSQPELWCLSPVPGQGLQEFEAHLLTGSSSPQSLLSQHSVPPTIPCKIPSEKQQRQATNAATSLQSSRRGNLCLGQDVSPTLVLAFLTPGTLRASPHSRNPQHLGVPSEVHRENEKEGDPWYLGHTSSSLQLRMCSLQDVGWVTSHICGSP